MRPYKGSWTDSNGKVRRTASWYVRVRDHLGRVQRFAGFTDKAATESLGKHIEKLVAVKMNHEQPGPQLT